MKYIIPIILILSGISIWLNPEAGYNRYDVHIVFGDYRYLVSSVLLVSGLLVLGYVKSKSR